MVVLFWGGFLFLIKTYSKYMLLVNKFIRDTKSQASGKWVSIYFCVCSYVFISCAHFRCVIWFHNHTQKVISSILECYWILSQPYSEGNFINTRMILKSKLKSNIMPWSLEQGPTSESEWTIFELCFKIFRTWHVDMNNPVLFSV